MDALTSLTCLLVGIALPLAAIFLLLRRGMRQLAVAEAYGEVSEITMRSTRVVTPDGKMLAIPNATIVNSTVVSYTNFPHLRIDLEVTIGVTEDIDKVRRILCGLVADDARYLAEPAPSVVLSALGDYNNTLRLSAWLDNEKDHLASRFALRERAYGALTSAGVMSPSGEAPAPLPARSSPPGTSAFACGGPSRC